MNIGDITPEEFQEIVNSGERNFGFNIVSPAAKPELSLVPGMTAEQIAALYKKLTGKEMTAEELADAERRLQSLPKPE